MPRWIAGAAGFALLAGLGRHALFRALERSAFVTHTDPPAPEAPAAEIHRTTFTSGDRLLHAAFAQATQPAGPAVIVFHGDDECLSDWAPVQALLAHAGISTFVFDYSGYGASSGRPTVRNLRQDALTAYGKFIAATQHATRRYVLGHSLGSGVLLDIARQLRPLPDGMVITSGFSSARAAAVQTGRVPAWIAWMLPDPWNNASRVSRLALPLLIVHSSADEVLPLSHAERLAKAATHLQEFVVLDGLPHDAATLPEHIESFWKPVIAFLQAGGAAAESP